MPDRIAVLFVHGVETSGDDFARTATAYLTSSFTETAGEPAEQVLVIRAAHWVPVLAEHEDRLVGRLGGGAQTQWFFDGLRRAGARVTAGSAPALLQMLAGGLARWLPGMGDFHWPALRWLAVQYIGDAIAYQSANKTVYDDVHGVLARSLRELAQEAGPAAPLCVVAHSLGSVVAGNYLYDVQAPSVYGTRPALPPSVRSTTGDTPLERGETLSFLYTLGSPLALYTLGLSDADLERPLVVPHPDVAGRLHGRGGWTNVYDPDDVIGSPLAGISPSYAEAVVDERVRVGPFPFGLTPLAHPWYWNDRTVMSRIGRALADAWAADR